MGRTLVAQNATRDVTIVAHLIHGLRDTITSMEAMRELAKEIGASLRIVDADHQQYLEMAGAEIRTTIIENS